METMKFDEGNNEPAPKAPEGNVGGTTVMPFQTGDNKRKKKLIAAGASLVVLILAVAGWQYWQYTQTPFYKQTQMVKAIDESLKESEKWGGKTPEETVRLFTEAIKKGDFELASKYGNRDDILPVLEKIKSENKIDSFIKDLGMAKLKENLGFNGGSMDLMIEENGKEYWIMGLFRSDKGTWKIVEF